MDPGQPLSARFTLRVARAVRCPTLLMAGEHDPLCRASSSKELVAADPDGLARLGIIFNASHEVATDNPEDTYRCIRDFRADLG